MVTHNTVSRRDRLPRLIETAVAKLTAFRPHALSVVHRQWPPILLGDQTRPRIPISIPGPSAHRIEHLLIQRLVAIACRAHVVAIEIHHSLQRITSA